MEKNERIKKAIRMRTNLPKGRLSVSLILKVGGMEHYLSLCSRRIADENLLDMEDVKIDFVHFPDILLTKKGMMKCRKILECYVPDNITQDAYEVLAEAEIAHREMNDFLTVLRETSNAELISAYKKLKRKKTEQDTAKLAAEYIATELISRLPLVKMVRMVGKECRYISIGIKYRQIIKVLKTFKRTEEYVKSGGDKAYHDKGGNL